MGRNSIWKMAEEKRAEDENENTRERRDGKRKKEKLRFFSFFSFDLERWKKKGILCHFLYCSFFFNDVRKEKKEEESLFFLFFFFCRLSPRRKSEAFLFLFTLNSN